MGAVGRVGGGGQSARVVSPATECTVEERRAELQKQLASLGTGWSAGNAQQRSALKAQLAALEPKPRPPPAIAKAGPVARPAARPAGSPPAPAPAPAGARVDPAGAAGVPSLAPERFLPPSGPPLRNPMLLGPDFREAATTRDVQRVDSGLVSPEKGKAYTTSVDWLGQRHEIRATFDDKTIAQLKATGAQIDIANGQWVGADGKRTSLLPSVSAAYRSETGNAAPRSLVRLGDADLSTEGAPPRATTSYVLPTAVHYLSDAQGMGAAVYDYKAQYETFPLAPEDIDPNSVHSGAELEPVAEPPGGFVKKQLAPGITVEGMSEEAIQRAMPSINEILGKRLSDPTMFGRPEELEKLSDLRENLLPAATADMARRMGVKLPPQLAAQQPDAARLEALVAQAKALAAPNDASTWSAYDAYAGVSARLSDVARQQAETRLVVVPEGKHWTAMPQFKKWADDPKQLMNEAVTATELVGEGNNSRARINVALPEGSKSSGEHELFHLLASRFMTTAELARVEKSYQSAIQNNGAFSRMYGAIPDEYWTTWSEKFRGSYGPRGVEFLKTKAPEIYEVMATVTGQRP